MTAAGKLLDVVTQGLNIAGSILIVGLMVMIGADVAGRGLLGAPLPGVPEMVSLSIVAIVFLQIPAAMRAGRLTRSDAVLDRITARWPGVARWLETVFDLIAIFIIWMIVSSTWPLFERSWRRGDFVGAIGDFTAPTWPVKGIIMVGCSVLILQFVVRILRRFLAPAEAQA
ncbi:TRAP transporter small permease subunit [Chachezhania antarctica]|uniref:TRAP transporter small permease subunit n=1 Tax=Chachezhania antarctica TaxID=2340860 RepID=UPI000EAE00C4|nr:TRAP transporter small permease subunit [Chachezhania antarctica]|tara:strand:+ start:5112 stop:5624 length:513 start_codon:yes stop_codon:yes gene_type:complete